MQKRQLRAADGAEIPAEAKVHAGKAAVEDIPAQVLPARGGDGRVVREQAHDGLGHELDDDRDDDAEAQRDGDGIPQRLQRAAGLARADALRAEGRHRREHGRRHEEQEADDLLHDADGGCVREAAAVGNDGNEQKRDLDQPVLQRDRHADAQDAAHDRPLRAKITPREGDAVPLPADDEQRHDHTDRLRERGAERGARRAHAQRAHEQIVERDVRRARDGDEIHRTLGIPQAAEDGRNDVVRRDQRHAEKADAQIGDRAGYGIGRGGHDRRDRPREREQQPCQHDAQRQKQRRRVADAAGCAPAVARADGLADRDRRAHGEADDHDREHVHDLTADGHGGRAGHALILADDEQVGHAVERLQEIREQIRQRKAHDVAEDAAGREIFLHDICPFAWNTAIVNSTTVVESRLCFAPA